MFLSHGGALGRKRKMEQTTKRGSREKIAERKETYKPKLNGNLSNNPGKIEESLDDRNRRITKRNSRKDSERKRRTNCRLEKTLLNTQKPTKQQDKWRNRIY